MTTARLAETLRVPGSSRLNHAVAVARPADLPARDLPFPPYALGAWLGDGTSRAAQVTSADPEIIRAIEADKRIPAEYLRASEDQRRALLAGLLDTDACINGDGAVRLAVTSERLAADVLELILSLGYRAT